MIVAASRDGRVHRPPRKRRAIVFCMRSVSMNHGGSRVPGLRRDRNLKSRRFAISMLIEQNPGLTQRRRAGRADGASPPRRRRHEDLERLSFIRE
jgi:hypothetical protein